MHRWLFVIMLSAMVISLPCVTFAQEEDVEYNYGTVASVNESKDELVVNEYDWDSDTEVTAVYLVTSDTKFENVIALKNIVPGDEVSIEYIEGENGKKIAKVISVYKPESEFESTEDIQETPDLDIPDIDY